MFPWLYKYSYLWNDSLKLKGNGQLLLDEK